MVDATHGYEGARGRRRDDARSHGHPILNVALGGISLLAAGAATFEAGRQLQRADGDVRVATQNFTADARGFIADITGIGRDRANTTVRTTDVQPVAEPIATPEFRHDIQSAGTHEGASAYSVVVMNNAYGRRERLYFTLRDAGIVVDPRGDAEGLRLMAVETFRLPQNAEIYNREFVD